MTICVKWVYIPDYSVLIINPFRSLWRSVARLPSNGQRGVVMMYAWIYGLSQSDDVQLTLTTGSERGTVIINNHIERTGVP